MNLNFFNTPEVFYNGARQKHIYLNNNYAWPYEFKRNSSSSDSNAYLLTSYIDDIRAGDEVAILLSRQKQEGIAKDLSEIDPDDFFVMGEQQANNRSVETLGSVNFNDWEYFFRVDFDENGYVSFYDPIKQGYLYAGSSSSNHLKTQNELNDNGLWLYSDERLTAQGTNTRNIVGLTGDNTKASCFGLSAINNICYCYFLKIKSTGVAGTEYIKKHAITLDVGSGDLPEDFLSENYCTDWMWSINGEITGLESYTPTKPASTFKHWELDGSNITYSDYSISEDTIVTAVWDDIEYGKESTLTLEGATITVFSAYSDSTKYNQNSSPTRYEILTETDTTSNIIQSNYKNSYSVIVIPAKYLTEMKRKYYNSGRPIFRNNDY